MKKLRLKHLKVFGLLFSMAVMCIAAFMSTETIQAKNIKNKTFYIYSEHKLSFTIWAIEDTDVNVANPRTYWPIDGEIKISKYDEDEKNQRYTVEMKDVNVTHWTPYLDFRAPAGEGYYPIKIVATNGAVMV